MKKATEDQFNELHSLVTEEFLARVRSGTASTQDLKAACDWLKTNDISGIAYEGSMSPSSYTLAENWGGQINFMIPLDREGLNRCRAIAAQQHEKMKLNYELVRIDNCAKLQQKGFMLLPGSRVYHLCSDVIPIASWKKAEAKVLKCKSPPKPWYKPWQKPKETCKMSTLSDQIKAREEAEKAKAQKPKSEEKKTTTTKE